MKNVPQSVHLSTDLNHFYSTNQNEDDSTKNKFDVDSKSLKENDVITINLPCMHDLNTPVQEINCLMRDLFY